MQLISYLMYIQSPKKTYRPGGQGSRLLTSGISIFGHWQILTSPLLDITSPPCLLSSLMRSLMSAVYAHIWASDHSSPLLSSTYETRGEAGEAGRTELKYSPQHECVMGWGNAVSVIAIWKIDITIAWFKPRRPRLKNSSITLNGLLYKYQNYFPSDCAGVNYCFYIMS